ncbi:MAG: hypothetical protein NC453_29410 [Muribaculum sp.]|nr:hypothetical protein [Muribaculum sp.]
MTREILSAVVFLLNIAVMAYLTLDARRKKPATTNDEPETAPPEKKSTGKRAGIGKSKYSIEDVRNIATKTAEAVVAEYFSEDIEEKDVGFDDDSDESEPNKTLSPEEIDTAFQTDLRIADEIDASNDTPAEPMADGVTFDELARGEVILGRKTNPTTEEKQYVVRVFAKVTNTQLMEHIPRYILDKLDECSRTLDEKKASKSASKQTKDPAEVGEFSEFDLSDLVPKSTNTPKE